MLRSGPYGDRFGADADGLTLAKLEAAPHGIDLGPLEPRLPEVLRTASGKIELAPEPIVADVERLSAVACAAPQRRHGADRPPPAALQQLLDAQRPAAGAAARSAAPLTSIPTTPSASGSRTARRARVSSARGTIEVPVEVTDARHAGRGQHPARLGPRRAEGVQLSVAAEHAGANSNLLADERLIDPLSGNAVLNGIPVELSPVRSEEPTAVASSPPPRRLSERTGILLPMASEDLQRLREGYEAFGRHDLEAIRGCSTPRSNGIPASRRRRRAGTAVATASSPT